MHFETAKKVEENDAETEHSAVNVFVSPDELLNTVINNGAAIPITLNIKNLLLYFIAYSIYHSPLARILSLTTSF